MTWKPSCDLSVLKARAELFRELRVFFEKRSVLEVETPLLAQAPVTDPYLSAFCWQSENSSQPKRYLQTSPEFAMKRLLSVGSGSIYQICKAFRLEEAGRRHNPEFTLLEWYRVDFTLSDLMTEVEALLTLTLGTLSADRISYRTLFLSYLDIDPWMSSKEALQKRWAALNLGLTDPSLPLSTDDYLQLLFSHLIEPKLGFERPCFVYDYPPSQAALAQLKVVEGQSVAARFEVYVKGLELANAYDELRDSTIQATRFASDLLTRQRLGLPQVPIDDRLLDALSAGLPNCVGIALGIDRLLMLRLGLSTITEVLAFPWEIA